MKEYPKEHYNIVTALLEGKFIISPSPLFYKIQELADEYRNFFLQSFKYKLNIEADFIYLSSEDSKEKKTRDFTLFLAILSRELDYSGKNFRTQIETGSFDIDKTKELLQKSSKWDILEKTTVANFHGFINTWQKRNLIIVDNNTFKFTKAIKLFFAFATEIAEEKLNEKTTNGIDSE